MVKKLVRILIVLIAAVAVGLGLYEFSGRADDKAPEDSVMTQPHAG